MPVTGKPTTDEMSKVLLEFHQRNQGLIRPPGPPAPFEVTSSVMQQQPLLITPRRQDQPPPDEQQRAFPKIENEFEFIPISIFGTISFVLQMWFRCHNEGAIGEESYIRLHPGSVWRSVNPPGFSGPVAIAFAGSTWTPTMHSEQGTFVQFWVTPQNIPPAPNYIYEAYAYFAMYIQGVNPPHRISDTIFPVGNFQWTQWYNAQHGIGFSIQFHTSVP